MTDDISARLEAAGVRVKPPVWDIMPNGTHRYKSLDGLMAVEELSNGHWIFRIDDDIWGRTNAGPEILVEQAERHHAASVRAMLEVWE